MIGNSPSGCWERSTCSAFKAADILNALESLVDRSFDRLLGSNPWHKSTAKAKAKSPQPLAPSSFCSFSFTTKQRGNRERPTELETWY